MFNDLSALEVELLNSALLKELNALRSTLRKAKRNNDYKLVESLELKIRLAKNMRKEVIS